MKYAYRKIAALTIAGIMTLTACNNTLQQNTSQQPEQAQQTNNVLMIAEQGMFSSGGKVITAEGTFNPEDHWEETGAGQTAHVDHANVLYQIPQNETGLPMVFLHGYDHFIFQDLNNDVVAEHIENWIQQNVQ